MSDQDPVPSSVAPGGSEAGWVIERQIDSRTHYWNGRFTDGRGWDTEHTEATRFARREDADRVLAWLLGSIGNVVEHLWREAAAGAVIAPSSSSDLAGRLRAVEAVKDRMVSMAVRRLPGDATRAVLHAFVKQLEAALRDPVLPVRSQDQDTKEETRRDGDTASRPTGSSRSQPKGSQR